MSYSFKVKAGNRKEAKELVAAKLQEVVKAQPTHENDIDVAQTAVGTILDIVEDPAEDQVLVVSVSGSLSWKEEDHFTGGGLNVNVMTVLAIHYQD